ncbi:Acetyltransferase (GNAT) family protein [Halobacillus dabanensis]|uniref:Acetyltransferase (GNAT) family protein n=1 Tax=Halobacillus dabanensis TaxID=240302 RepID=A0A1I4ARR4_HALDA|nr:GNAT family N-acetyltransferase [Halobacillus dabanensis]SFK59238.1 Acetyltransferase (GNAT) family protein [Halobacillus dabanensis]
MKDVNLTEVEDRIHYIKDLLLADESESVIKTYMNEGEMYKITYAQQHIGVCLFLFSRKETVEIKNIAIRPGFRGMGIGKKVIDISSLIFQNRGYKEMLVGTANSSIGNLAFYQKAGFRFHEIQKDFFLQYPDPFFENGIQGLDMIILRKAL